MSEVVVSIEQVDCTSCGLCEEVEPKIFYIANDGIAYVKEEGSDTPQEPVIVGFAGTVAVSSALLNNAIDAAEECPGECIYLQFS